LRHGVRRPGVPPDARDLRRPRCTDRDAGRPRRRGRRDRVAPPAGRAAPLDRRRDRSLPRGRGERRGAPLMHNRWHPDLEPVAEVDPGEELRLETEDGLAGQLTRTSMHADAGTLNLGLGHPLAGPVFVRGAEPGDVLEVEFVAYETDDFGTTPVI